MGRKQYNKLSTMGKEIPESVVGTHKLNKLDEVADGSSSELCCRYDAGLPCEECMELLREIRSGKSGGGVF